MTEFTIRGFQGPKDARPQYELWLEATKSLTRAWRSCLRNVEFQLQHAAEYPQSRLYAVRPDGRLIGYIGVHPPFDWVGRLHGPPSEDLGWTIPFGFPWSAPWDSDVEVALYEEMLRVVPRMYSTFRRDIYIQRFRESWSRHLAFLEARGWRQLARVPLLGRSVVDGETSTFDVIPIRREDLGLVSQLCHEDDTAIHKLSAADLEQRYDAGWIVSDTFWRVGQRGAFAFEQRGPWAAVTVLLANPDAWDETLAAAAAKAGSLGVEEIYFTVEPHEEARQKVLQRHGFREVDAGVYYVRDAD